MDSNRYRIVQCDIAPPSSSSPMAAVKRWVILDTKLDGFCALPAPSKNLLPLEWKSRAGAEAWLNACYRRWGGKAPA